MRYFIIWIIVGFFAVSTSGAESTFYTCEELLVAVNAQMREWKRPEFTMDELTVCLARQADSCRRDGKLLQRVSSFLEELVARRRFKHPVGIHVTPDDDVQLDDGVNYTKKVKLPRHCALRVDIYNELPNSPDSKIQWSSILVAAILDPKDIGATK